MNYRNAHFLIVSDVYRIISKISHDLQKTVSFVENDENRLNYSRAGATAFSPFSRPRELSFRFSDLTENAKQ